MRAGEVGKEIDVAEILGGGTQSREANSRRPALKDKNFSKT